MLRNNQETCFYIHYEKYHIIVAELDFVASSKSMKWHKNGNEQQTKERKREAFKYIQ